MPTAQRSRTIAASPQELWDVVGDPHHLPRWWPRVSRVESVTVPAHGGAQAGTPDGGAQAGTPDGGAQAGTPDGGAQAGTPDGGEQHPEGHTLKGAGRQAGELGAFTEVLMSPKGKMVRADFKLLDAVDATRIVWSQEVEDTPFARVLKSAETEVTLAEAHATEGPATEVTIELRQELQGFRGNGMLSLRMSGISRFGSTLVRRAAHSTIEEALDGLEWIFGR